MSQADEPLPDDGIDPFLDAYLEPFRGWLAEADVTELLVNRPGEVWIEQRGKMTRYETPAVDDALLQRLAEQVARISNQGISRERPLLAAMLPNGARVQFVAPTATRAHWALAIRRHCLLDINPPDIRVRDFGSLNGTYVNGTMIGQREQDLSYLCVFQFNDHGLFRTFVPSVN